MVMMAVISCRSPSLFFRSALRSRRDIGYVSPGSRGKTNEVSTVIKEIFVARFNENSNFLSLLLFNVHELKIV